jgi:hypothetical protein
MTEWRFAAILITWLDFGNLLSDKEAPIADAIAALHIYGTGIFDFACDD